jgi:NADPH2:quinone reductase
METPIMTRAIVVRDFAQADGIKLEPWVVPAPGADQVLLDVHVAGLSFGDVLVVAGKYQNLPERPFVPGFEVAGTVAAVGDAVSDFKAGDRVLAQVDFGAWAEQAQASARRCYAIPDAMSFNQAVAIGLNYQTAHFALFERGGLRESQTVLITGAAGGVGLAAVQLAKAYGAHVLAGVNSEETGAIALKNGADALIELGADSPSSSIREQVMKATSGRGADLVIEQIGGDIFEGALRSVAWSGRLVVIGFAGGTIPSIKANYLLVKNISVSGLQWTDYRDRLPGRLQEVQQELFQLFLDGRIKPVVGASFPCEQYDAALDLLRSRRSYGKIVLNFKPAA